MCPFQIRWRLKVPMSGICASSFALYWLPRTFPTSALSNFLPIWLLRRNLVEKYGCSSELVVMTLRLRSFCGTCKILYQLGPPMLGPVGVCLASRPSRHGSRLQPVTAPVIRDVILAKWRFFEEKFAKFSKIFCAQWVSPNFSAIFFWLPC